MVDLATAPDLLHIAVQYLAPAITGAVAGVVASIAAPWANWEVERRKARLAARRELVGNWRVMLSQDNLWYVRSDGYLTLLLHRDYGSLRPHLKRDPVEALEAQQFNVAGVQLAADTATLHSLLANEIARIE